MGFTTGKDISDRFDYHPPAGELVVEMHQGIREITKDVALHFNEFLPDGREKALAITKLEEAMFWANAAVARNQ